MRAERESGVCGSRVRLTQLPDVPARAKIIANAQVAEAAGSDDQTENHRRVFRRVVTSADIALRVELRGAKHQEQSEGKKGCKFLQDVSPKLLVQSTCVSARSSSQSIERGVLTSA